MFLLVVVALPLTSACIAQKPVPISSTNSPLPQSASSSTPTYSDVSCKDFFPVEIALSKLSTRLESDLFGQPLASKTIVNSLKAHWNSPSPRKALVLSFHGSSGTGKTHVANILISSISRYSTPHEVHVHRADVRSPSLLSILGSALENGDAQRQRIVLLERIRMAVHKCPRAIVLIDDADQLEEGVLDALLPLMEFHEQVNGLDYRQVVFILINSVGGREVNDVAIEKQAIPRHELHIKDFEKQVTNAAFNIPGGLHKSQLISRGVIDVFVPFLPLSRLHVEQCIRDHLRHSGKMFDEEIVFDVASSFQYFHNDFSSAGCKKVGSRTDTRLLEEHDDL